MPSPAHHLSDSPVIGTGWAFPPRFSRGTCVMASGVTDIEQSLAILLATAPGERVMLPDYGCDLTPLLFAPLTTTLAAEMADRVQTALLKFEPRITPERVTVSMDEALEGRVLIDITYVISTTNSRHNYVYPFFKLEGTEVR